MNDHQHMREERPDQAASPSSAFRPTTSPGGALQSIRLSVPVAVSYIPVGIALGVLCVTNGIAWYWAPISALTVFAGSVELLGMSFIVSGVSIVEVALTAFVFNFRHIFYGLNFPIKRLGGRGQKGYGVFALTDETYAITSSGEGAGLNGFQITILQLISHFWWVASAALGALVGQFIPSEVEGFEFALTAMFVTLAMDAIAQSRAAEPVFAAVVSGAVAWSVDQFVYEGSFLLVGPLLYVAYLTWNYVRGKD